MNEQPTGKISPFTLGVFVVTLFPISALLWQVLCGIAQGARMPFEDAALDATVNVIGFLVAAAIGHAATLKMLPAARSRMLTARTWRIPVACGIAVSAAAMLVEPTTDVLGDLIGHHHENPMLAGSVIFWSGVATATIVGIDALAFRLFARHSRD